MIPPVVSAGSDFSTQRKPHLRPQAGSTPRIARDTLGRAAGRPRRNRYPASRLASSLAPQPPSRVRRRSHLHAATPLSSPLPDVDLRNPHPVRSASRPRGETRVRLFAIDQTTAGRDALPDLGNLSAGRDARNEVARYLLLLWRGFRRGLTVSVLCLTLGIIPLLLYIHFCCFSL